MAALETPWLKSMGPTSTYKKDNGSSPPRPTYDPNPPTVAAFSPQTLSGSSVTSQQRSTIIVHRKSPLLVATPPQVTRSLAYSHPFILPLNKLVGLLSWSTGDPWESFLLVAGFWAIVLYGDHVISWAGPIIVVAGLIVGMYIRRYSPLSSTTQTGEKHASSHKREPSDNNVLRQHKSLDEIVETLREFTTRCNLLLDPFRRLTDFLSTQSSPTSATTRPALTTLFIRTILVTPLWISLTLPPLCLITTRRVILACGTIAFTWHSRPARVARVILWRSLMVRRLCMLLTGLSLSEHHQDTVANGKVASSSSSEEQSRSQVNVAGELASKRRSSSAGVRFTFILYENQRRWLGIGWTYSLLAYERAAWTDEYLNAATSPDKFQLPDVEGPHAKWRWTRDSEWKIEGGSTDTSAVAAGSIKSGKTSAGANGKDNDGGGWIYYDNKWSDGKRVDGWGRYTRRRKWYRDAELVEVTSSTESTPPRTPQRKAESRSDTAGSNSETTKSGPPLPARPETARDVKSNTDDNSSAPLSPTVKDSDGSSSKSQKKKSTWFGGGVRKTRSGSSAAKSTDTKGSADSGRSRDEEGEENHHDKWRSGQGERERQGREAGGWGVGEDAAMGLS